MQSPFAGWRKHCRPGATNGVDCRTSLGGGHMVPLRRPLVLALLGAGIVAADRAPEAQVFVPELAMLDGALCVSNAARAPTAPLIIAQAARAEVSPAASAAAAAAAPGASAH